MQSVACEAWKSINSRPDHNRTAWEPLLASLAHRIYKFTVQQPLITSDERARWEPNASLTCKPAASSDIFTQQHSAQQLRCTSFPSDTCTSSTAERWCSFHRVFSIAFMARLAAVGNSLPAASL
mmetsp:Transcript_16245/g.31822  ORF Transcript_16245/g.31822 Transcript_16245/m.31822 type:complete len:124 (+) Transcript_16245:215-586(+)